MKKDQETQKPKKSNLLLRSLKGAFNKLNAIANPVFVMTSELAAKKGLAWDPKKRSYAKPKSPAT